MSDENEVVSIIVVKHQALTEKGFGLSYSIFSPLGYSLNLFRRLIYSGCKAIAIKELMAIHLEAGKRVFPYDFVETPAG